MVWRVCLLLKGMRLQEKTSNETECYLFVAWAGDGLTRRMRVRTYDVFENGET